MAHFCRDYKITFENRVVNCPRCGYGIANDDQPESFYIQEGYTRFRMPDRQATPDQGVHIQDDDILNDLRGRYTNYVNNMTQPEVSPSSEAPSVIAETPPQTPQNNAANDDFFASFASQDLHTPEVTVEPEPAQIPIPNVHETPRTNNYYTPHRGIGGFGGLRGFSQQIPWRAIFYLAVFIAVIVIIATIWKMRFAILDSVLGFLGAIMPLALIVIGIIYLIRSAFRR